jgi:transposase
MRQKSQTRQTGAAKAIKDIRRATRKQYSAEEKIRIVLDGLRGEETIAELCRREGIAQSIYYKWSKEFLEAGKRRLAGDTARAASSCGGNLFCRISMACIHIELQRCQVGVKWTGLQQFLVGAGGDNAPVFNNRDAVGIDHSSKAVGNHQCGSSGFERFQSLLNKAFTFRIQSAGSFIQ